MASAKSDLCTETGSLSHKPATGWLHSDETIRSIGKSYSVRYMGCLQILTSMRKLDFDIRSQIAKESVRRVCKGKATKNKTLNGMLGTSPLLGHAGEDVAVTVTSSVVTLTLKVSGEVMACHDTANISFASGGESLALVAYVAKDSHYGRACFVLECASDPLARDLITTLGQAFEVRFKDFLNRECCNETLDSIPPRPPSPDYSSEGGEALAPEVAEPDYTNCDQWHGEQDLSSEPWFHRTISRKESEARVKEDGDFLVRESRGSPGQYILTGMTGGSHRHLLLVDPQGVVRTKFMTFRSVSHLVDFHREHNLPISSSESRLHLQRPA